MKKLSLIITVVILMLVGCKKDDGVNLTIVYKSLSIADWQNTSSGYQESIDVPEINQDISDNGFVMVYEQVSSGSIGWRVLPDGVTGVTTYVGTVALNRSTLPSLTINYKIVIGKN